MKSTKNTKRSNEQGIVSIMVTIILMLVISLIVISFAGTSRREQRDSFDRQLSTNAFYAAESGINAARNAIKANPSLLDNAQYITDCNGPASFASKVPSILTLPAQVGSATSNASYTCLFVDPTVSTIEHSVGSEPFSFPLKKAGAVVGGPGQINVYWDAGSGTAFSSCPAVSKAPPNTLNQLITAGCDAGVLRVELTDSTDLTHSRSYFIYPGDASVAVASIDFKDPTYTRVYRTGCGAVATDPQQCKVAITGLNNVAYARVSSIYKPFELTVKPSNSDITFQDAQVLIDVTGKAADVQRRIQVRYSPDDFGGPAYAAQAGAAICKQFTVDSKNAEDKSGQICWPPISGNAKRSGTTPLP